MAIHLALSEVLEVAIQKEIDSQCLYSDLSQKVEDKAAKYAFQELVKQEEAHQELLERYMRGELEGGALNSKQPIDYHIAERFKQLGFSADMPIRDVFLLAAEMEMLSHEFYLSLAGVHPEGEVKRLLEGLAAQELEHKRTVEFLYTQVGFPQTDGG